MQRKNRNLSVKLMALLFAMSALQVSAKNPHEFSVFGSGGYSFFSYRRSDATVQVPILSNDYHMYKEDSYGNQRAVGKITSAGSAGDIGVGFTGFLTPQFGLHVGLGVALHNVGVKVDYLKTFSTETYEDEDKKYTKNRFSTLYDYRETYRTFSLTIPLMLQFQTMEQTQSTWRHKRSSDAKAGFYGMAGVKLNVLISNTYESKVASLYNTVHIVELHNWADTQEVDDLGWYKGKPQKGDFGFVQAFLAVEAGMKWRISSNMFLYTGGFLDYALNDPSKNDRKPTSDYTTSESIKNPSLLEISDQQNLMVVGVKLRLAFIKYSDQLSCPQF